MPPGDDVSALADWIEIRIAADGGDLPLARLRRLLRNEGTELADEEMQDDEREDVVEPGGQRPVDGEALEVELPVAPAADPDLELRIEEVRAEIEQRMATGTKIYPFSVTRDRIEPRADVCGKDVYLLLLVLGSEQLPFRPQRRAHQVEEVYDLVALAAVERFLGRGAKGVRFARTARAEEQDTPDAGRRPTSFPAAIAWLRDHLDLGAGVRAPDASSLADEPDDCTHWEDGELPGAEPLGRPPLTSYNDAGVDVVVWWRFADGRAGFPVLMAQCTVQLAWQDKLDDIKLVLWEKWIDFDTVPPQRALVIPFATPRDHPQWRDRTTRAGTIIDRIRLVELLDELGCEELEALIDDTTRQWTAAELAAA